MFMLGSRGEVYPGPRIGLPCKVCRCPLPAAYGQIVCPTQPGLA